MQARKQQLLKRHRRNKRIALLLTLLALLALGIFVAWWWVPLLLVLGWIGHEAWFADHLFYSPSDDYRYDFPKGTPCLPTSLVDGQLRCEGDPGAADTLILEWDVSATWLGRSLDPHIYLGDDRQDMERRVDGRRYFNLSGQGEALVPEPCASAGVSAAWSAPGACSPWSNSGLRRAPADGHRAACR